MEFIFKYAWVLFVAGTLINVISLKKQSQSYIAEDPTLKEGYDKLIKGWLIYGNIPWLIMAIGDLTGITNGVWDYFNPKSMNPMVLLFHITVVILWIIGSNWIYFKGGADFIVKHPGLVQFHGPGINKYTSSPLAIKIFWALALLGGITGMVMMWMHSVPATPEAISH